MTRAATITPIRPGAESREAEPIGELLASVEISLACLQDRLEDRFGKRKLGRTVNGRFTELWKGIGDVRATYRREVGAFNLQVDRFSKRADHVEALIAEAQDLGLIPKPRPDLQLATGGDDA